MTTFAAHLLKLVDDELLALKEPRVVAQVQALLVPPIVVHREWDYGNPGEEYPCWSVLEDPASNTGIAYCELGFGPSDPWGLVFLSGDEHMSIGMDSAWYPKFLDAYFQSAAAARLPIWRVYRRTTNEYPGAPISSERDWKSTWRDVKQLREQDPSNYYSCEQSLHRSEA